MNDNELNSDEMIDNLFDELDFKPITDGLGFHHSIKEEKDVKVSLSSKKKSLEADIINRASRLKETEVDNTITPMQMGELAPFYQDSVKEEVSLNLGEEISLSNTETHSEATMEVRFAAWIIDLMVLSTLMAITVSAIIIFADLPLELINRFMVSNDLLVSFGVMFAMFYAFYFAFFDKTSFSTPGKRIMNIKVTNERGNVSLLQSLSRVSLSLFSILTLGLISFLKLQDKLTETKVVKK